jgi:hypothetical protein
MRNRKSNDDDGDGDVKMNYKMEEKMFGGVSSRDATSLENRTILSFK